jgi:hypothetical protein
MENATFRKWLIEQGCRFDTQHEERGEGHGTVTIHREGRTAELSLVGSRHELDPHSVRQSVRSTRPQVVRSSRTEGPHLRCPSATRKCLPYLKGLQEVVWVFWATSEGWKHACEHLEPQIFLVA